MLKLKHLLNEVTNKVLSKITVDDKDGISADIMTNGQKVGTYDLETYDGKVYTIVGAEIDPAERGKGYYYRALFNLLDQKPNIKIYSAFRSPEADRAWTALIDKTKGTNYNVQKTRQDGEVVYILTKR